MPGPDFEQDEAVLTESETRLKKPPLYKVLIHNDDYTTMEFVIFVLQKVFQHAEADAARIMLQVHIQGVGVAGVYTYEIAETKVAQVETLARAREFPLLNNKLMLPNLSGVASDDDARTALRSYRADCQVDGWSRIERAPPDARDGRENCDCD
jgi:ATP-dependent Clp protease adaptor protein ClpS